MPDNDDNAQQAQEVADVEDQQDAAAAEERADESDDESTLDKKGHSLVAKYRREAALLRKQLKETEPVVKRLKEIEDKDKSETQKLTDQLAGLQTKIAEYEVREVRTTAAAAVGLPPHMAIFITASDLDEAKAQAKALLEFGKGGSGAADFKQGARTTPPAKVTGDDIIRRMAGRG